jgi:hypothetical protein
MYAWPFRSPDYISPTNQSTRYYIDKFRLAKDGSFDQVDPGIRYKENIMASGDTLAIFHPYQNEPPTSNFATRDNRNYHPVLDFDQTTQETAIFSSIMPRHYAGGGVTVYAHWMADVTSGTVGWDVSFERMGGSSDDMDSDSWNATPTVITAATVNGTQGVVSVTNVSVTNGANMDNVVAGDSFRLRIRRDVANDNAAGDANLLAIEVKET